MKKKLTELVMILDRSGSMSGLESDTIGGYNAMLRKQAEKEGDVLVSTVLFDDRTTVVHDRISIKEIKPMSEDDYFVGGCTALLDALGGSIRHIKNVQKYAREEDRPEKTIFVITTDGMENASRYFSYRNVKMMVKQQQEKYGWEFLFLGANIDAVDVADSIGIRSDRAAQFISDSRGTKLNYETVSDAISMMRCEAKPISGDWKKKIEQDYKCRNK